MAIARKEKGLPTDCVVCFNGGVKLGACHLLGWAWMEAPPKGAHTATQAGSTGVCLKINHHHHRDNRTDGEQTGKGN